MLEEVYTPLEEEGEEELDAGDEVQEADVYEGEDEPEEEQVCEADQVQEDDGDESDPDMPPLGRPLEWNEEDDDDYA